MSKLYLRVFYLQVTLILGWILSTVLILSPLYLVTLFLSSNYDYSPWIDPAYCVLHGPMVSVGVSWIILVCTIGYGGTSFWSKYCNKTSEIQPIITRLATEQNAFDAIIKQNKMYLENKKETTSVVFLTRINKSYLSDH